MTTTTTLDLSAIDDAITHHRITIENLRQCNRRLKQLFRKSRPWTDADRTLAREIAEYLGPLGIAVAITEGGDVLTTATPATTADPYPRGGFEVSPVAASSIRVTTLDAAKAVALADYQTQERQGDTTPVQVLYRGEIIGEHGPAGWRTARVRP